MPHETRDRMEETQPHRRIYGQPAPAPRQRSSQLRRGPGWRRRLVILGILLISAVGVGMVLLWQRAATFNEAVSTEPMASTKLWGPLGGSERVNVLLLGHSPGGRDGAYLSDSITVLSIDPTVDQTTSISIPRDLWVEGHADLPFNGKANEAFALGYQEDGFVEAGNRATRVISSVTGLDIAGWISLDFDGFRAMVDAVDGITLANPRTFRWAMGPEHRDRQEWAGSFETGAIQLDGLAALRYARARYTDTPQEAGDFARSARQQLILAAVRQRLNFDLASVPRSLALADALAGQLHTNLSVLDLALLAGHLSPSHRIHLEEGVILEAARNSAGQYVLVVIGRASPEDFRPLHTYLTQELEAVRAAPG